MQISLIMICNVRGTNPIFKILRCKIKIISNLHNVKTKKLNCSLHTKKTNNTNKLTQIGYHFAITKI